MSGPHKETRLSSARQSHWPHQQHAGRHGLAWLTGRGWVAAAASVPAEQRHVLQRWQAQDWPLVIRRRDADAAADELCLGIAVPPDDNGVKLRIAVRAPLAEVRRAQAPPAIADVIAHAAPPWRTGLEVLRQEATTHDLSLLVYGSLALQALTGQTYLRPASDIDLLFTPQDFSQLQQGMQLLQRHAQSLPLDGEVAFPDGAAVSWKEWLQAGGDPANRVLVKRADDVVLARVSDMLAGFDAVITAHSETQPCQV